jgi:hypothetical protein
MVHEKYLVEKLRTGREGKWRLWEYEAVSATRNDRGTSNAERGVTERYLDLYSLAQELATFPGILNAEFVPGYNGDGPRVSLFDELLTQNATISDEELGLLAVLVYHCKKE